MAIFHSYVSLPEGRWNVQKHTICGLAIYIRVLSSFPQELALKNHEKSKKSKKSNFSKLLLWEKLGDIRNTMPSRKPGLETRQWVSMSAISAVRILPQMSAHDILRNSAHSIVEKCILVCIWFSKCGSVILWSEFAFLFPLTQNPSFSNRKAGVPTYPGKLVPGSERDIF